MPRITIQAPAASPDAGTKGSSRDAASNGAAATVPTDDEILGLATNTPFANRSRKLQSVRRDAKGASAENAPAGNGPSEAASQNAAGSGESAAPQALPPPGGPQDAADAAAAQSQVGATEPEELQAVFEANPELRRAWHAEKAFREIFPNIEAARQIAAMFPTIEQARAAQSQLAELEQLDSWFFSGQPEAHAELAAAVYRMNPAAFRSLAQAINQTLARFDAAGKGEAQPEPQPRPAADSAAAPAADSAAAPAPASARNDKPAAAPDPQQAGRFASFYQETNAAVVEGLVDAIRAQVERLLPEGAAAGARNRVVGEIYRELDASLRSNRALAQQVRQAFRSGTMDADHQAAVAGLILGRARQALPTVAKRVINEWTTGVLTAADAKLARQRAAASRVDITGGGAPGTVPKLPLSPKDVDYSKLTDADILNL